MKVHQIQSFLLLLISALLLNSGCTMKEGVEPDFPRPEKKKEHIEQRKGPGSDLYKEAEHAQQTGHLQRAEIFMERALRLEPHNGTYWYSMGQIQYSQKHYSQAIQFCLKSISLAKENPHLTRTNAALLIQSYQKLGEDLKAEQIRLKYL